MATDGQVSFVTFLYDDIQWRDMSTQAGIDGDKVRFVDILESVPDARNLDTNSNVGVPGMWIYRVDSSDFIFPLGLP